MFIRNFQGTDQLILSEIAQILKCSKFHLRCFLYLLGIKKANRKTEIEKAEKQKQMLVVCKQAFDAKRRGRCKKLRIKIIKIRLYQWGYTEKKI